MRLTDADEIISRIKPVIDAERQIFKKESWDFAEKCLAVVESTPTVDAIWVIRCNDCKHHDDECLWCKKLQRETENDCYCSLARKRNCND